MAAQGSPLGGGTAAVNGCTINPDTFAVAPHLLAPDVLIAPDWEGRRCVPKRAYREQPSDGTGYVLVGKRDIVAAMWSAGYLPEERRAARAFA